MDKKLEQTFPQAEYFEMNNEIKPAITETRLCCLKRLKVVVKTSHNIHRYLPFKSPTEDK